jgi:hypothetical protein
MNDPLQVPPKSPSELPLNWHDRILNWSGWEQMAEYRWQLIGAAVSLVAVVWLLGWWFARSESSSVANSVRADLIVQRLRNPGSSSASSEVSVQQDLQRLEGLCPHGTPLAARFSGVIAEEQILQNVHPLSNQRFSVASENLVQSNLPLESAIVLAAKLTEEGKNEESLRIIDDIIAKTDADFPAAHAYALLQKITLLRKLKQSNANVVEDLQQFLAFHPDIQSSFDLIFSGKTQDILAFLKIG